MNRECYERLSKIEAKGYLSKGKAPSEKQFGTEFNKTTIALQTLHVLLLDVIADRVLEEKEVIILKDWLATNDDLKGNYPYDRVFNVIEKSVEDGILVQDELDEMLDLFTEYTNPVKKEIRSYDITKISGKLVCLTGEFKYGQKSEVTTLLEERGAICKDNVTSRTDILIVGGQGSASWKCGTYGGKIKKAMEMKEKGFSIQIYDENEVVSKCIPQI
jgi:DNA polymerase-3 subunit epsilon